MSVHYIWHILGQVSKLLEPSLAVLPLHGDDEGVTAQWVEIYLWCFSIFPRIEQTKFNILISQL